MQYIAVMVCIVCTDNKLSRVQTPYQHIYIYTGQPSGP
jgi:hypothetical protein